jgi:hypothetical protein
MKRTLVTLAALAVLACGASVRAQHAERCEPIPKAEWKPQAELERKLTARGWKVSRIKIENGCYEVYGRDEKNNKVETFFHPKTLEVVTATK